MIGKYSVAAIGWCSSRHMAAAAIPGELRAGVCRQLAVLVTLQAPGAIVRRGFCRSHFAVRIVTARAGHPAAAGLETSRRLHEFRVLNHFQALGIRCIDVELDRIVRERFARPERKDISPCFEDPGPYAVNAALHVTLIANRSLGFCGIKTWIIDCLLERRLSLSL